MKKNGFTLVELLAVIVILAIVLLISVPMIYEQIQVSKKGAAEGSCNALMESASNFFVLALSKNKDADEFIFECNGSVCMSEYGALEVKGKVPTKGKIRVTGVGKVEIIEDLEINGYVCKRVDGKFECN